MRVFDRDVDGVWLTPQAATGAYVLAGGAWIVLSDWVVTALFGVSELTIQAQLLKGLFFVGGSGAVIYALVTRRDAAIHRRDATIRRGRSRLLELRSAARESAEFLEVVLSNITETVVLTDEDGRFTYVCPNVSFVFGRSAADVRALGDVRTLLGEDFPFERLEGQDLVENVEHRIEDAEGRTRTVLVSAKSVSLEAGAWLYSVRDISERKDQEERFRTYVENSSDVITVIDDAGVIEYVSPAVERVFGYDPESLIGRNALELVHPDARELLWSAFESLDAQPSGTTLSKRYRTRHADGTWVWTESRMTTRDGAIEGSYVLNTRDVSELHEREGRLSVLDRVLRHNLRNKLNVVIGSAGQIEPGADEEFRDHLDRIAEAAEDMLQLSEKARDFDATVRRHDEAVGPIDIVSTARRVVRQKRTEYPRATLRTNLPEPVDVLAHKAIDLALAELVDNAVIHSGRAHPTVDVDVSVDGSVVEVRVADDGPGIPDADRTVIEGGHETQLEHGMNLGLWLVRWTIENSDGQLTIGENEPRGTEISLHLPRASAGGAGPLPG